MSLVLLVPAGLLAGIALALPLLLHLQRASDTQRVDFAALRWLRARLRPRRRLRLREWLLLGLRLLLVALVAVLLAQPAWLREDASQAQVYLAPGVSPAAAHAATRDLGGTVAWHRLVAGLPEIDDAQRALAGSNPMPAQDAPAQSLSSLLREADARTPPGARLVVVLPPLVGGLDAERPRLAHAVDWRVLHATTQDPLAAAPARPPPHLAFRYNGGQPPDGLRFLRAAAASWSTPGAAAVAIDAAASSRGLPPEGTWLAWFGPGDLPAELQAWVARGGTALLLPSPRAQSPAASTVAWQRDDGTVLAWAARLGQGRLLQLARPLSAAELPELLEPGFPQQLRRLFTGPLAAPRLAPAAALRPRLGGPHFPLRPEELAPWLALAAGFVFLCERLLATRARRAAGA